MLYVGGGEISADENVIRKIYVQTTLYAVEKKQL